jgi:hypothetical protein
MALRRYHVIPKKLRINMSKTEEKNTHKTQ